MNDLELYRSPGGLQTYSPSQPLQPVADAWGEEVDYATEPHSGGATLFGEVIPGATHHHMQQAVGQISGIFLSDFSVLGHNPDHIQAAISWLKSAATRPPQQEIKQNNFPLFQYENDAMAIAFSNAMHRAGASAQFVSDALWWITELEKQINGSGHDRPQATDGNQTTSDPLDQLSDEQYAQVIAINDRAKAETMDYLRDLWGSSFTANLRTVNSYFQSLPQREQDHLSQLTTGWVAGTNTKEILLHIYNQAIGAGSISNSGAGISDEIAAIENLMKTDRKSYLADNRLQMRLRELYRRRGY